MSADRNSEPYRPAIFRFQNGPKGRTGREFGTIIIMYIVPSNLKREAHEDMQEHQGLSGPQGSLVRWKWKEENRKENVLVEIVIAGR